MYTPERVAKRTLRSISKPRCKAANSAFVLPQGCASQLHTPIQQVSKRRNPHQFFKAKSKARSEHADRRGEFVDFPVAAHVTMHQVEGGADPAILQSANPSRYVVTMHRHIGTKRMYEQDIGEPACDERRAHQRRCYLQPSRSAAARPGDRRSCQKGSAFDPTELAQGARESILSGVARELAKHERGCHRTLLD